MTSLHRLVAVASAALFFAGAALAQNAGTVSNHAVPVGKGAGKTGFGSLAPITGGVLSSTSSSADPSFSATLPAQIGVLPTDATTNRNLATWAAQTPYIEEFGGASGGPDNTAAFNLAYASGSNGVRFKCLPVGSAYNFNSKPTTIIRDFRILGCEEGGNAVSSLFRNYTEATSTNGLFSWTAGRAIVKNISITATTGTGGAGISIIPSNTGGPVTTCNIENVTITAALNAFEYSLYLNGEAHSTAPLGLRSCYLNNANIFGANTRSVYIKSVVHFNWNGGAISTAGGTDGSLELIGTAAVSSQEFSIAMDALQGDLILDRTFRGTIIIGHHAGNITNTANTSQISGMSALDGTLQNNWTSSRWVADEALYMAPATVATLPTCNAGSKGARSYVSNNNTALAFAAVITAGGALETPVYCDGTVWRQG